MIFSCFTEKVNCAALHLAAQNGHFDVCKIIVEQLEDIDPVDINGETPLYFAAKKGHLKIYRYLIKNGADKERGNNLHMRPKNLMILMFRKNFLNWFLVAFFAISALLGPIFLVTRFVTVPLILVPFLIWYIYLPLLCSLLL